MRCGLMGLSSIVAMPSLPTTSTLYINKFIIKINHRLSRVQFISLFPKQQQKNGQSKTSNAQRKKKIFFARVISKQCNILVKLKASRHNWLNIIVRIDTDSRYFVGICSSGFLRGALFFQSCKSFHVTEGRMKYLAALHSEVSALLML